jgi:hypothetical protein
MPVWAEVEKRMKCTPAIPHFLEMLASIVGNLFRCGNYDLVSMSVNKIYELMVDDRLPKLLIPERMASLFVEVAKGSSAEVMSRTMSVLNLLCTKCPGNKRYYSEDKNGLLYFMF